MKRNDWYLALIVIVIALFLWGARQFLITEAGTEITVTRAGQVIGVYSLAKDDTLSFVSENGDSNILIIQDKEARMSEADCPDGLCVKQGAISARGESIICLPHKLVIEVTKGMDAGVDAVVQ